MGNWGKVEFENLRKFDKKLQDYLKKQQLIEDVAKELTARLLARVIPRTPVGQYPTSTGKVGGTLRRGWTSTSHKSAESSAQAGDSYGDIVEFVDNLKVYQSGKTVMIEIINPVEYAKYVEMGHRTSNHMNWVEGQHFLRISVNDLNSKKEGIVKNIVYEQLKELFL